MRFGFSRAKTIPTYSIQKDRLGTDAAWRSRRSAASEFRPIDFYELETPIDDSHVVMPGGIGIWRPLIAAIVMAFSIVYFVWVAPPYAYVGSIPMQTIFVIFAFLLYATYVVTIIAMTPRVPSHKPEHGDKWRYIAPGWSTCHFTTGTDGLAVDGTHFLYFFEWADLKYVEDRGNKLVLRNFSDYYLVVPDRFFETDRGGDLDWDNFKDEIRKYRRDVRWSTHN